MRTRIRSALRVLFQRTGFERDFDEELRFHIDAFTDELIRSGVPPEEAARRARIEFGNPLSVRAECREARGGRLADALTRNLRYALRMLWRTPHFTLTTAATLALCLGSALTIFAVVDAVLVRPLAFPSAGDLVSVYNTYPHAGVPHDGCSLTNYYERRGRIDAFAGIAAYREQTAVVGEPDGMQRVHVTRVTADFFTTLGLEPLIGRSFTEDELRYPNSQVAILTHHYWKQRMNGVPDVLGRLIRVDGLERTVVGVLPAAFRFLSSEAQIYLPLASDPEERAPERRHWGNSDMIARLRPGISVADAQSQVDTHNAALEATNPDGSRMAAAGFRSVVIPLHADHVAPVRKTLLLLQAGVLMLLGIGAVNITNLFLIRAAGRERELALRQALGAARRHVIGEVMTETGLVALAGGVLGIAAAAWGIALLRTLGTEHLPLGARIAFDARVALAGLSAAVLVGAGLAAPIAWYHLRAAAGHALRPDSRGATQSRGVQRLRHGFVVAQIAFAFVLLAGAGLLALSLHRVMTITPGFASENILTGQMTLPAAGYPDRAALLRMTERLLGDLVRQPGIDAAGFVTNVPLSGTDIRSAATPRGYVPEPGESPRGIYSYGVGGDYFAAMGYSLHAGRFLNGADVRGSARVCVVDEDFAARFWPGRSAIGQQVFQGPQQGSDDEAFRIVGVVGAVKQSALTEPAGQGAVYYPFSHRADRAIFVVARTSRPPDSLAATLRESVRGIDPELPVTDIKSMDGRLADSLVARRTPALLAGVFSGLALLLAAIGTYGVLSYAVAERRREIGIRLALGAGARAVAVGFMASALRMAAIGLTAGAFGAWLAGRAMRTILFDVPAVHPGVLVTAGTLLALIAVAAATVPARRAASIDPLSTLRAD